MLTLAPAAAIQTRPLKTAQGFAPVSATHQPSLSTAAKLAVERRRPSRIEAERYSLAAIPHLGNHSTFYKFGKRVMDIIGALCGLLILSPIMLTTLVVLTFTTRGKPIFSQERVGLCGRRFRMFKFRTMAVNAHLLQHLVQNEKDGPIFKNKLDPRITAIGRFLRSTSIDEMPQLLNVLFGDMALVGPRPPVPKEVAEYHSWQFERLSVKPGLTCLWQVSGRSEVGFEDWVRMDIWYVRNQSFATDLSLLVRTPLAVLSRRGAY
jgi:lipopolysaccharide/colanic/teichoic acid biosynthesis glycosyltransferase